MKKSANGAFKTLNNDLYYVIDDIYKMEDFFLTIPSSSDAWIFLWSQGGITAGRGNSNNAIFPYYTDDKISDMKYTTGAIVEVKVASEYYRFFDPRKRRKCSIRMPRNLMSVTFEEEKSELGLTASLTWTSSESYGIIKKVAIKADRDITFTLLDGSVNIMPCGMTSDFQNTSSTLLDAYKKSDLDEKSGLVALALSSLITDRAEPNEALAANVTYFSKDGKITLSPNALDDFEEDNIQYTSTMRGERGAASLVSTISLKKGEEYKCYQVFDTSYSTSSFLTLREKLSKLSKAELEAAIDEDIALSSEKLNKLIKEADGIEDTGDDMASIHHEANVLFNIMRGGTFIGLDIDLSDFNDFLKKRNKDIFNILSLPEHGKAAYSEIKRAMDENPWTRRLFYEYIPLTFSRRHGDPSRPWNRFDIKVKNKAGEPILNYEGNWRDIFQNWEALSLSYPMYLDHMITRFLDTMTVDGYNPYKINRDGFDWEEPDPNNPWAAIGYWNDHQVIYLVRLLELSKSYGGESLTKDLSTKRFSSANVPYRIKSYSEIEKNPHSTIIFDRTLSDKLKKDAKEKGSDLKLVQDKDKNVELVSFSTKILQIILSKIANLVPDGGIWMNTERPEWNDANNALAGFGLSIVSTAALRLLIKWYIELLEESDDVAIAVSLTLLDAFNKISENFKNARLPFDDKSRLEFVRANGKVFEKERERLYKEGFSKEVFIAKKDISDSLDIMLSLIDETLNNNKREDGLYHSYNVLYIENEEMKVLNMKLQLEGQVALLSSGLINGKGAIELMRALKNSQLKEEITGAYTLYPDKDIPLFWEKNNVLNPSGKMTSIIGKSGRAMLEKDSLGNYHFNPLMRNKEALGEEIGENKEAEDLYEKTFNHRFFTGRSDSFFRYEGLGSIYWHMVSKLLLAVAELIEKEEDEKTKKELINEYREIRASLGYKRDAKDYGSFPFMPYSHTPKGKGAKQPGMTGQVKEEIITRNIELGVKVKKGCLLIKPNMLEKSEFKADGSLHFTKFDTPITYTLSDEDEIELSINGSPFEKRIALTAIESKSLFERKGKIKGIDVKIPKSILA